ncbi:MAG: O-antigen ligase family protein [Planctomycetes bacterium]|nr:O-antigen ligase family protein [Planctomycetota bacterium]
MLRSTACLTPRQLATSVLMILVVAGILCTGSRGGAISMAVAGVCVALVFLRKRQAGPIGLLLVGMLVAGAGLAYWTGLGDDLAGRLGRLIANCGSGEVRLPHWRDASRAAADFWPLGTGFGTYRYAYLPYQTRLGESWFFHAENQYLEALVEGGVVGLILLLSAIALVFLAVLRLVGARGPCASSAIACAGLFALVSQGLHSLVDFGLYIPANMLLFAMICGVVSAAPCSRTGQDGAARWPLVLPSRWMALFLVGALGIFGVLGLREVSTAACAETAMKEVPPLVAPDSLESQQADAAIRRLTRAAVRRPGDAELRVRLAELWVYRYRLQAYRLLPETTTAQEAADRWQLTGTAVLHQRANAYHRLGDFARLEELRSDSIVQDNLETAIEHWEAAKQACPILPRIDLQLAAVSFVRNPDSPSGERHLRNAVGLTPGDPDVLYMAGTLAGHARLDELKYDCWRRSLDLSWRYRDVILAEVRSRMELAAILDRVLPDSPQLMIELARTDYAGEQYREERALLVARARELVASRRGQLSETEWHHFQAVAYELEGRLQESIASHVRALELDPLQTEWRFKLATLLEREGRLEQAYDEAKLCTLLAPDSSDYRSLVQELNSRRLRRLTRR